MDIEQYFINLNNYTSNVLLPNYNSNIKLINSKDGYIALREHIFHWICGVRI